MTTAHSHASNLGAVEYEAETLFGEDQRTFATFRIPHVGEIDLTGLKQDKIPPGLLLQYLQEGTPHILGPYEGTFKTNTYIPGHGSSTSGATAVTALMTYLSFAFGKISAANANGTTCSGAGTATAPGVALAAGFLAGSVIPIGTLGDGDGEGQFFALGTHAASVMNLLNDLISTAANGVVVGSSEMLYFPENPTDAACDIPGIRLRAITADQQVEMHGCYPIAIRLTGLNTGERRMIEVTWGVSWWRYTNLGTFPSTVTATQNLPEPNTCGSFFMNIVGTPGRSLISQLRSFSLDIQMNTIVHEGPGGVIAGQKCIGATRGPSKITFTVDAEIDPTVQATPTIDGQFTADGVVYHALYTLSTTAGKKMAIRFNQFVFTGPRPVPKNVNGVNCISFTAEAQTGPTKTSALTSAAMIVAVA